MIKHDYESSNEFRALNRSLYRNMPSSCDYCGYRRRPSSSGESCSSCCMKYSNYTIQANKTINYSQE